MQKFEYMCLRTEVLDAIKACGLKDPSYVQKRAIMPLIKRRDVIVQAPRRTGISTAYAIGMLQNIDTSSKNCQALVLVTTRERAMLKA